MSAPAHPTILVLGSTGLMGREVVRSLNERGVTPRVLVRDPGRLRPTDQVEIHRGDLRDPASLREAMRGVDAVFHISPHEADEVELTRTVLDAVEHEGARLVFSGIHIDASNRLAKWAMRTVYGRLLPRYRGKISIGHMVETSNTRPVVLGVGNFMQCDEALLDVIRGGQFVLPTHPEGPQPGRPQGPRRHRRQRPARPDASPPAPTPSAARARSPEPSAPAPGRRPSASPSPTPATTTRRSTPPSPHTSPATASRTGSRRSRPCAGSPSRPRSPSSTPRPACSAARRPTSPSSSAASSPSTDSRRAPQRERTAYRPLRRRKGHCDEAARPPRPDARRRGPARPHGHVRHAPRLPPRPRAVRRSRDRDAARRAGHLGRARPRAGTGSATSSTSTTTPRTRSTGPSSTPPSRLAGPTPTAPRSRR